MIFLKGTDASGLNKFILEKQTASWMNGSVCPLCWENLILKGLQMILCGMKAMLLCDHLKKAYLSLE